LDYDIFVLDQPVTTSDDNKATSGQCSTDRMTVGSTPGASGALKDEVTYLKGAECKKANIEDLLFTKSILFKKLLLLRQKLPEVIGLTYLIKLCLFL